MAEIWRNIKGYEGLYMVSNQGRIKSLKHNKEKILKSYTDGIYLRVDLYKDGKKIHHKIHRLVAQAYIPNPNNLPQVNHINEDKSDNRVENLEWCTAEYNINYGTHNEKSATTRKKPLYSVNKTTNEIVYYQSISDASIATGVNIASISKCLNKIYKTTKKYKWYYIS